MKYSFELKEPLPRKLLRYALWAILITGFLALVVNGAQILQRMMTERSLNHSAGELAEISPEEAVNVAEKLNTAAPSENTRLRLIRVAAQAQQWQLADILLDEFRPANNFRAQALDVIVSLHVAPETLKKAVENLKAIPQNDDERILLAQAAVESGDRDLQTLARRALRQLESDLFKNRASLLLARMAMNSDEPGQAKDLAVKLLEKKLPASDAVELLKICETLQMPEANDYRSSLKMAARTNPALAMALIKHFSQTQTAQVLVGWVSSLPAELLRVPQVSLELVILQLKANDPEAASQTLQKMGNTRVPEAVMKILMGENPKLEGLNAQDLALYARFCHDTQLYPQELAALGELNRLEPRLWSLCAATQAAQKANDAAGGTAAWEALQAKLPQNALVQLKSLPPRLLDESIEPKNEYEALKKIYPRYSERNSVRAWMAYAHYRLGNLTDALVTLPPEPSDATEKLLSAVIYAQAGQNDKAGTLLREISPNNLSTAENELYQTTLKSLQQSAPLKQLMDNILKPVEN